MNKRNFGRVIKRIEANRELFDQGHFPDEGDECGTPYCFAGHAEILRTNGKRHVPRAFWPQYSRSLQKFLGLSFEDISTVFSGASTLSDFKRWHKAGKVS